MGYVKYIGVWGWLSLSTEAEKYAWHTKLGAACTSRGRTREEELARIGEISNEGSR